MDRRAVGLRRAAFAASLPESCPGEWRAAVGHPFVVEVASGRLAEERFHRWLRQDRLFVVGLRGFVRALVVRAPASDVPGLEAGLAALEPELELFSAYAAERGVDLHVPLEPACESYLAFLAGCARSGYVDGLTAYYGCERAYLEAWTTVRDAAGTGSPYARWIENWTSEPFGSYVAWLGERLDAIAVGLPDERLDALADTFRRAVLHEVAFWDACFEEG